MRTVISVSKCHRTLAWEIDIVTQNGRPLKGLRAGRTPSEAAARAASYAICHCIENPQGGDIVAPSDIMALIPEHLRNVKPRGQR